MHSTTHLRHSLPYFALSLGVIVLDQGTKLWTHFAMTYGYAGEINVIGQVLKLHYITNPGMAFGIGVGANGKWLLSVIRIAIVSGLVYYMYQTAQKKHSRFFMRCLALILGGAIGNVMDGLFYGVWLNNAAPDAPTPWLHGQVVDMIYVDIWKGFLPDTWPFVGGAYVSLWPIFNLADSAIFIGVCLLIVFSARMQQKKTPY